MSAEAEQLKNDIDYSAPINEIYERYASQMIQNGHLHAILCQAGLDRQSLRLPSWVPDWSDAGKKPFSFAAPPTPEKIEMNCGPRTLRDLPPLIEGHKLRLKASIIDSIPCVGSQQPTVYSAPISPENLVARVVSTLPLATLDTDHTSSARHDTAGIVSMTNITTARGLKAWIPDQAQGEDLICSIKGSSALFVLRVAVGGDGGFCLIGECFVNGSDESKSTCQSYVGEQDLVLV